MKENEEDAQLLTCIPTNPIHTHKIRHTQKVSSELFFFLSLQDSIILVPKSRLSSSLHRVFLLCDSKALRVRLTLDSSVFL